MPSRRRWIPTASQADGDTPSGNGPATQSPGQSSRRRDTDDRGFVVPAPGDIVLHAGRWANEDVAALVERVRYLPERSASVVDVVEMRSVGSGLYALAKKRNWYDIADIRIAMDAEYVVEQDAYRVNSARSGYAEVTPLTPVEREKANREYSRLKDRLLTITAAAGGIGTLGAAFVGGWDLAYPFSLGAVASLLYLFMLQRSVDIVGTGANPAVGNLLGTRFIVPTLPFLALSAGIITNGSATRNSSIFLTVLGSIPKAQAAAVVIGLLTYKVPLFLQTGAEALDSVADIEVGKGTTGMLGTSVVLAARALKRRSASQSNRTQQSDYSSAKDNRPLVFVFAGPSGSGKSTIIHKLFEDIPGVFEFCISHTTREQREGETEGVDYYFVDESKFKEMIRENEFVEYAQVHGNYYGTSSRAIDRVLEMGKACVLDLDVQGVKALSKSENLTWSPRFVWIAPPSIKDLEERLVNRGTESDETLARRLTTARREMEFAATSNVFDRIIINKDISTAYQELKAFIENCLVEVTTE